MRSTVVAGRDAIVARQRGALWEKVKGFALPNASEKVHKTSFTGKRREVTVVRDRARRTRARDAHARARGFVAEASRRRDSRDATRLDYFILEKVHKTSFTATFTGDVHRGPVSGCVEPRSRPDEKGFSRAKGAKKSLEKALRGGERL